LHIIKNSVIYLSSSILNKAIPFLLLPILTKYLSPEEYGVLSIFQLLISFSTAFVGMNMSANISKNFFKYNKQQTSLMIGNILIILLLTTLIYFLITLGVSFYYQKIFSVPSNWVVIIPVLSFMFMINTINLTILRNQEKAILFGIYEIANTAVNMGVTILLLLMYHYGWYSQAVGMTFAYTLFFIISFLHLKKNSFIILKYDGAEAKKILKLSIPLIPHVVGGIIIALSDRFFIERMVSLEMVGIYSVGYMFGVVVILFTDAFIKAWSPWFYKILSDADNAKKIKIVKYSYLYILATFIVAFGISIFAKFIIPYVVNVRYVGAEIYVFWIAIGYAVHGVYKIFFPYLVHISKTSFLGVSTIIAAVLNLIFNYFLIKEFGAIGAAYSTVLSFIVSASLVFWYQNKHFKMPWFYIKNK
jgi:O-antigen/teichoic acid export membrane protein